MWFISQIVTGYFNREPTKERLAYFNDQIRHFTENLQIPETREKEQHRDLLEERRIISDAIKGQDTDPINCAWRILVCCAQIEHGQRYRAAQQKDVQVVLARLPNALKNRVLNVFRKCIENMHYKKERSQEHQISMTRYEYEIPFWILRAEGDTFAAKTLKDLVTCYGFSGASSPKEEPYKALLEEIRNEDKELWKECVYQLLDDSFLHSPSLVVRYLVELEDPLYLDRCSERLSGGKFSDLDFNDLLFYLALFSAN